MTPSLSGFLHVVLFLAFSVRVTSASNVPTSFVFILADDMGWGDPSYNNASANQHHPGAGGVQWTSNPARTPNLDAMATSAHSLVLNRFYSGSPVCSPTRAAILSGRTPDRDCIFNAEGCGQEPAWACADNLPFPPTVFTAAEAAKVAGLATLHVGKWHLGNFFPKPGLTKDNFVNRKWPSSHPGMHGFDIWHSTEASASSSMCNCGCRQEWIDEGEGCVIGGGKFKHEALACTNYWYNTDAALPREECHKASTTSRDCVANLTSKIAGDDSEHIVDVFEDFLEKVSGKATGFMAHLWLHTVHEPHPAMPHWFHAYVDVEGNPAGDYLGTLSQMDVQVGRVRELLKKYGVANDTMLIFTADNGPHIGLLPSESGPVRNVHAATNGLRQCKASVFEGGIRVPGLIEWPGGITQNAHTETPAYVSDFLPTVLDYLGVEHPRAHEWHFDGVSLRGLIEKGGQWEQRGKPLSWRLGKQVAMLSADGRYKLVKSPEAGQCPMEKNSYLGKNSTGPFLFDLWADPTESEPLNEKEPQILQSMTAQMEMWEASIATSQILESECAPPQQVSPDPEFNEAQ